MDILSAWTPAFFLLLALQSMADDYECTLDAASIKKAKAELNEDPADRLDAVKALREWLLKQPHITSRSGG